MSDRLPECAELWEWIAAEPRATSLVVAVDDRPGRGLDPPEATVPYRRVSIRPQLGPYGWSEELGIGVVFFGRELPVFDESSLEDGDVRQIVDVGRLEVEE